MKPWLRSLALPALATLSLALCGCAQVPPAAAPTRAAEAPARPAPAVALPALSPAVEERVLALDPGRISAANVRDTLSQVPPPHIVLLHGGIFPVHLAMVSFGRFLTGMGYPEERIRNPGDGRWSHSPYEDSTQIAGLVGWYYEQEAMRPMMIGHSQGGVQAVKVLREIAGQFGAAIPVWDPRTDTAESRTTIVDPLTGRERPVIGLTVCYVSVVGAGGAALILPNQWSMVGYLYTVPDTVDDFTGYSIGIDLIAGRSTYRANGTAHVRNVMLPAAYNHVTVPVTASLAEDATVRAWIDAYHPDAKPAVPIPDDGGYALLWAADVWWSVKKHWAQEAQRMVRARRELAAAPANAGRAPPVQEKRSP